MSFAAHTPSQPMAAVLDPIARQARADAEARNLRMAVTNAVVRGHLAFADFNARVSILEAGIAELERRRSAAI